MACSNTSGEADLFIGTDGDEGFLSSLRRGDDEWSRQARSERTVKVRVDTLTNLLSAQQWPHSLGILFIDAEGLDYEVLQGLDFSRFRPSLVMTEESERDRERHAAKHSLLIHNGYDLLQRFGSDTIWFDRTAVF